MSTRLKVFFIITAIVLAITASSVIISISSAQSQILRTLEDNMQSLVSVANEYVMGEMELLKTDAASVAFTLEIFPPHEIHMHLFDQLASYDYFEAIAIFNAEGRVVASETKQGIAPPPPDVFIGYSRQVLPRFDEVLGVILEGERLISGSYIDDSSGELVFYVFVPLGFQSALGLTVSGNYFSDRMNQLTALSADRITIVDSIGTVVADEDEGWVINQVNFLDLAASEPRKYNDIARVIEQMVANNTGVTRFALRDFNGFHFDNIIAFAPIISQEKWAIAVSTSVAESAYPTIRGMIAVSGIIFLALGSLAAALASGVIAKPFELLKAAEKAKTAFIANMSHDMRTPLNAIISFSQLSRTKKDLPPGVADQQLQIYESGMAILGVVNDLLDISNIESGKFGVLSAEYDFPGFINDTALSNLRHIGSKPVELNIITDEKLPARLNGDSLRVRQIFNNLLSNAIRHTKKGAVEWRISTEKDGYTVWMVSSVSDSGSGIKPEDIDKLFLDYSSLDTQKMRSTKGGTGLGLALTKKIVDVMSGTLTVESVPGKGTTFKVRLPHTFVNDEITSAESVKNFQSIARKQGDITDMQRVQLPGKRVLVVDDVEINLAVARGMIEPYGITADCVLSGKEAVDLVRKGEPRYDAIFMNRWMPEMDGIEAARIIRNEIDNDYARNVPIIALVANAIGNNTFFLRAGFQAVLSKPISLFRLDDMIQQWVAKK